MDRLDGQIKILFCTNERETITEITISFISNGRKKWGWTAGIFSLMKKLLHEKQWGSNIFHLK